MKERIEDLGRVCEMLRQIVDHEVFDWNEHHRNKDTAEWFAELNPDKQFDKIHDLAYSLSYLHDKLHEAYQIARWGDEDEIQYNNDSVEDNSHSPSSHNRFVRAMLRFWSSIRLRFRSGKSNQRR